MSPGTSWLARQRVATVPNAITVVRLLCLPLYCVLLFGHHAQVAAAALLAVLGITDFADGYIARHFNQVSELGKILDPVADRLLVGTAVLSTAIYGAVPWWFATLTLLREVLISVAVVLLASAGASRIDVLWIGKAGTLCLMVAYPLFLLADGPATWQVVVAVVAWGFGLVGLVFAWIALGAYLTPARAAWQRGRRGRAGSPPAVPGG